MCVYRFVRPNFLDHFDYLVVDVADDSSENIISHFPEVRAYIDNALETNGEHFTSTCLLTFGGIGTGCTPSPFVPPLCPAHSNKLCTCNLYGGSSGW
jgi:hypothetical protein